MNYLDILRAKLADWDEQRNAALDEMDAATTAAVTESRSTLTPEEDAAFVAAKATLDTIENNEDRKATIVRVAQLEAVDTSRSNARRAPVAGVTLGDPADVPDVFRLTNNEARARAVTMIERSRMFVKDQHKTNLVNLIEQNGSVGAAAARMALVTSTDDYQRGWSKYMSGNTFAMTDAERFALAKGLDQYSPEERAGMTSGTGASGGYFVPVFIDPTMILTGAGSTNPFRHIATVKTIGPAFGGWYGATAAQVTAAWTAEGSAAPDNTPVVGQPNIPVYMGEAFVQVSYQAFEDISDLAGDVQTLFADAKDNLEAVAHSTSTGSGSPTGVSYAVGAVTASRVSPTTGGAVAIADVFLVQNALPERFQDYDWGTTAGNLAWTCNVVTANKLRSLAMAQNSANSLWTDLSAAQPPLLSGAPIYRAGSMSSSLTTGQDVLLYGDFSRYYIIDRIGFTTEFVPNLFDTSTGRPVAQRGWMSHWRTGANVVDANAFRQLRL